MVYEDKKDDEVDKKIDVCDDLLAKIDATKMNKRNVISEALKGNKDKK